MANQDGWKISLDGWKTMKPIIRWNRVVQAGEIEAMNAIMAGVVEAWPFEGDPKKSADYEELSPSDWAECVKRVGEAVGAIFQNVLRKAG